MSWINRRARKVPATAFMLIAALFAAPEAYSAQVAKTAKADKKATDFFFGRTITVVVPTALKLTYGMYARLMQRFICWYRPTDRGLFC